MNFTKNKWKSSPFNFDVMEKMEGKNNIPLSSKYFLSLEVVYVDVLELWKKCIWKKCSEHYAPIGYAKKYKAMNSYFEKLYDNSGFSLSDLSSVSVYEILDSVL